MAPQKIFQNWRAANLCCGPCLTVRLGTARLGPHTASASHSILKSFQPNLVRGSVLKRSTRSDCKSDGYAFAGSNPARPTTRCFQIWRSIAFVLRSMPHRTFGYGSARSSPGGNISSKSESIFHSCGFAQISMRLI